MVQLLLIMILIDIISIIYKPLQMNIPLDNWLIVK